METRAGAGPGSGWGPGGAAVVAAASPARGTKVPNVDLTRLIIGLIFALLGVAMLVIQRGTRGFNQQRQAGAMFLAGAVVFCALGLGWF